MKTAFLFSGQGAQYVGMGSDIYKAYPQCKAIFDNVSVDFDLQSVCFHGPQAMLDDTAYAQCCIFTVSSAIAQVLRDAGVEADGCAGLSLGEYSAYAYANTCSIQDGARLTRTRGKLMAEHLPADTSGMCAILMLDSKCIQQVCKEVEMAGFGVCEIANYNCPGQVVITGHNKAIAECAKRCLEKGARRCIPLQVSGAFHSSLLKEASTIFAQACDAYTFKAPSIPVYNNISGEVEQGSIKDIFVKQFYSSVHFEETIRNMYRDGYRRFIEIGPGSIISGFVKKTLKGYSDSCILHIENEKTLEQALQILKEAG